MIEDIEGFACDDQTLVHGGQKLEENKSLDDYNITDFNELELVLSGQLLYIGCVYVI